MTKCNHVFTPAEEIPPGYSGERLMEGICIHCNIRTRDLVLSTEERPCTLKEELFQKGT